MNAAPHRSGDGAARGFDHSACEREPIHIPGAVQPHGALLAVAREGLRVTHASANLDAILGRPTDAVLGQPLALALGEAASLALGRLGDPAAARPQGVLVPGPEGDALHLHAFATGSSIAIDIEPVARTPDGLSALGAAQAVIERFLRAGTASELCTLAAAGLRELAGYDRVMAYRFAADGHGEVIAEAKTEAGDAYLGLHYPAGDIPSQARRLYLEQRVGSVADCTYVPVPLLTDPGLRDAPPLDLTHSALRSVSPMHRQYMRNMGTRASLTIGLAGGASLWGMLVCHHATPRIAPPDLRSVAGLVGTVVSLLLAKLTESETLAGRHERHATLRALIDRLSAPLPLPDVLAGAEPELLRLVGATGAVVSIGGLVRSIGAVPEASQAERALALMQLAARGQRLAVDDLGQRQPALAPCAALASGALLLPLGQRSDDAILWLRPERRRTLRWGGNPSDHGADAASPRTSFAAWLETVDGRSAPWTEIDLAVAEDLGHAIEADLARRNEAALIEARTLDARLGQPDRHRDLERSNAALEEFAYAASHDLKAPLRAIGHLAQWIAEDVGPAASPDTSENLRLLQARVARLQSLLDGLLTYSRVGRQAFLAVETIELPGLVADIVATLGVRPGFSVECQDGVGPFLTHRVPLGVVLSNLIGNAIRHHDRDQGRVVVSVRRVEGPLGGAVGSAVGGAVGGALEFRVEDDGPGIAPRFHERVFQIFQTLASRDDVEASGIGLAVVRRHVEAQGGRIRIESAPPARGTSFVFTWNETAQ